jgi:hypothetical protein
MTSPEIAKHVYINPVKGDENRFTVDGEEFPWYISERGPQVAKIADNLFTVHVEIPLTDKSRPWKREDAEDASRWLSFSASGYACRTPIIGGQEFPWVVTEDGFTFSASRKNFPTVSLAFFAAEVEFSDPTTGWCLIDDKREIYDVNGDLRYITKELQK